MKRVSAHGKKYNAGSEKKWADWQVPPVICAGCGERVTLKQNARGDFNHATGVGRTWHSECERFVVRVVVSRR